MRIALAQINVIIGDFEGIEVAIRRVWERARNEGAHLLVLPELASTGYPPQDLLASRAFVESSRKLVDTVAGWTAHGPAVVMGAIAKNEGEGNDFYNCAELLADGCAAGRAIKTLLPTYDVFDEHRYFEPSPRRGLLEVHGIRLGVTVCEDIWVDSAPSAWGQSRYEVDPSAELAAMGAELFINISASPFTLGKAARRRELVADCARSHGLWMVYVNQVGAHDELIFDGHSLVVNPDGDVVARLDDFDEDFAVVDIPVRAHDGQPAELLPPKDAPPAHRAHVAASPIEEAYRALVLGIRDYVHKSGFRSALLGLSGGIDSAVVAVLAADALGPEQVWGIGMPTRYSSDHSVEDARALAENLGIRFDLCPIESSYSSLLAQLAPLFGDEAPGLAEENAQARLRGVTLMALSNRFGHLLLSTSNKSEAAVGYTTLYGDMNGALAVIADVCKTQVYELAQWINRDRVRIPVRTITKPPSAELRPDQTDQDSLPPYEVVDAVVRAYVEEQLDPRQVAERTGVSPELVETLTGLIDRAEYKRWQSPPVLKITDKAFGVGRRMPIVARYPRSALGDPASRHADTPLCHPDTPR